MRIIGGELKGLRFNAPQKLPVRPTTDMAKEALFNILHNNFDLEQCNVLDLFSGTGSVAIEFASRGVKQILAIDKYPGCISWIKSIKEKFQLDTLNAQKQDVFKYIENCNDTFDIIFADPPYHIPEIPLIPEKIKEKKLLKPNGLLIIEHPSMLRTEYISGFQQKRKYGNSSFSFFSFD